MGLPYGEEIMIVGRTVWTQSTSVTDGRTDRQTDRITITKTVQRIASHGKNRSRMALCPKPLSQPQKPYQNPSPAFRRRVFGARGRNYPRSPYSVIFTPWVCIAVYGIQDDTMQFTIHSFVLIQAARSTKQQKDIKAYTNTDRLTENTREKLYERVLNRKQRKLRQMHN